MKQTQRTILSQKVSIQQRVQLGVTLLEVPITAIERALEDIIEDPNSVEERLRTLSKSGGGHSSSPYTFLVKDIVTSQRSQSVQDEIEQPPIFAGTVVEAGVDKKRVPQPDITYIVRGYGEFSITPAEHFQPSVLEMRLVQFPSKTKQFARWLISQKNWMVKSITECYQKIGKRQAGFLLSLDPKDLNALQMSRLSESLELPYTYSTYYRLLRNRSIKIESPNGVVILPVVYLMPRAEQVVIYNLAPILNKLFEDEFREKRALSDFKMLRNLDKRIIARRTIAKYRELAGIPNAGERQRAYNAVRTEPYKISTPIEAYLPSK